MEIVASGGALGAEVKGIDMRAPLKADEVAAIKQGWNDHLVLVVRGQFDVTLEHHLAFSRHFGELALSPPSPETGKRGEYKNVPPEVAVVSNIEKEGKPIGALGNADVKWHTDSSFFDIPPAGGLLRAIEVPEDGSGATSFLNLYSAYESLADELKAKIEGCFCNHSANYDSSGRPYPYAETGDPTKSPGARHPLVRTHPETGRKCLFLGRRLDAWIVGLPIDESEELLDAIWAHATADRFKWTHEWRNGDMVMWDNRCVMHRRDAFDPSLRRHMQRTQIVGTKPA
ncbi:MAG: TauD/TfdA family dioxygenase [Pseudomonadota bacterium]|nr:TauD/TfdA family dioxygenase [Pseudomonadota bacterium]